MSVWQDSRTPWCEPGEPLLRAYAGRVITPSMGLRAVTALAVMSIAASCRCSGGAGPPTESLCAPPEEIAR